MQRSNYFNNTRPTEDQLNYTEQSRVNSILRRLNAACQMGVVRGFEVAAGGVNNSITISAGEGYTGGNFAGITVNGEGTGERIGTLRDDATGTVEDSYIVQNFVIANALSVRYYINLVYTEIDSTTIAEVYYPFDNHSSITREYWTVESVTAADYALLSLAELQKRVLVAIVTGGGVGNPVGAIQQVVQPSTHPVPTQPINITGVSILQISNNTQIGTGTLTFDSATGVLTWQAPADSFAGPGVDVSTSGGYTLTSGNAAYTITVQSDASLLPVVGTPTDSISVGSLYSSVIPRFCSADTLHRDMVGSGQVSSTNPHGITLDDLSSGTFSHADLYHTNGISDDADRTAGVGQLECFANDLTDNVEVINVGGASNSFLIQGESFDLITGYTAGNPGLVNFDGTIATGRYMIYLDSNGSLQRVSISTLVGASAILTNVQLIDMQNTTAGTCNLTWDTDTQSFTYTAQGDVAGTPVRILPTVLGGAVRGYYKIYSSDVSNWVIIYVSNDPGVDDTQDFTVAMTTTQHESGILKLCTVDWLIAGTLDNLSDIRQYLTADNRDETVEEHDAAGAHTKVFRNPLRVAVQTSPAVYAACTQHAIVASVGVDTGASVSAGGDTAVYAVASRSVGAFGSAVVYGVVGRASASGVKGSATVNVGVLGVADQDYGGAFTATRNYGAAGYAVSQTGVYGSAGQNFGGVFIVQNTVNNFNASVYAVSGSASAAILSGNSAAVGGGFAAVNNAAPAKAIGAAGTVAGVSATGVFGNAPAGTGVYGTGALYGIVGFAVDGAVGIWGTAGGVGYGIYGSGGGVGVYGTAVAQGVRGSAAAAIGVIGIASATGVYGQATNVAGDYGVIGSAARNYGVYGLAAGSIGVMGSAVGNTGGYFKAANIGVAGTAVANTGVYGSAAGMGVYGKAANTGVFGSADGNLGGCFAAAGAAATGLYGGATDGTGVYGVGKPVGGYFVGSAYGILATGTDGGAYGIQATGGGVGGDFSGANGVKCDGSATADLVVVHGTTRPAIFFGQASNGAPAGAIASYVYVRHGANTYALALYATAV